MRTHAGRRPVLLGAGLWLAARAARADDGPAQTDAALRAPAGHRGASGLDRDRAMLGSWGHRPHPGLRVCATAEWAAQAAHGPAEDRLHVAVMQADGVGVRPGRGGCRPGVGRAAKERHGGL